MSFCVARQQAVAIIAGCSVLLHLRCAFCSCHNSFFFLRLSRTNGAAGVCTYLRTCLWTFCSYALSSYLLRTPVQFLLPFLFPSSCSPVLFTTCKLIGVAFFSGVEKFQSIELFLLLNCQAGLIFHRDFLERLLQSLEPCVRVRSPNFVCATATIKHV